MKLRFTTEALAELDDVLTYIAERSPSGAQSVRERVNSVINLLAAYPNGGQQTSNRQLRRIVAVPYPYLVYYEVTNNEIVIVGIRHAARDPASMPDAPSESNN